MGLGLEGNYWCGFRWGEKKIVCFFVLLVIFKMLFVGGKSCCKIFKINFWLCLVVGVYCWVLLKEVILVFSY